MSETTIVAGEGGMELMDEAQRIITIRQLLECGVHFGHRTERWNPKMKQYIFGARNGVHIIDLQQTAKLLRRTYAYIRSVAADGQPILFVGTKRQAQDVLISEAQRCGQYFVVTRWLGGTLTNWKTIRQSVDKLRHIVPNLLGPVVIYMTLLVPHVIILESFLSFLGLGVQEPMTSWGVLISTGAKNIGSANWLLLFPAIFLVTTLFALQRLFLVARR